MVEVVAQLERGVFGPARPTGEGVDVQLQLPVVGKPVPTPDVQERNESQIGLAGGCGALGQFDLRIADLGREPDPPGPPLAIVEAIGVGQSPRVELIRGDVAGCSTYGVLSNKRLLLSRGRSCGAHCVRVTYRGAQ